MKIKISHTFFLLAIGIVITAGLLTSCGGGSSEPQPPVSTELNLNVLVIDENDAPVPNARIYVQRVYNNVYKRDEDGITDLQGKFKIRVKKPSDVYFVNAFAIGFEPSQVFYSHTTGTKDITLTMHPKTTWSIISYNILYGLTWDNYNNQNKERFVSWIKAFDTDLVFLQETNNFNETTLLAYAARWGHTYSLMNKSSGFPCSFTSKFPFTEVKRVLGRSVTTEGGPPQTPENPYFHHGYLRAKWNGIYLYSLHLDPFHYEDRKWEIDSLLRDISSLPTGSKVMIAGDFNSENRWDEATVGSEVFRSEFYRYRTYYPNYDVTDAVLDYGLKDSYTLTNPYFKASTGKDSTYLTSTRNRWRIDYAFVSSSLASRITFSDILKDFYTDRISDHYPVHIRMRKE